MLARSTKLGSSTKATKGWSADVFRQVTGIGRRLAQRWSDAFGPRVSGSPPSPNGASSLHLAWLGVQSGLHVTEAAATLEIVVPPAVPHLYFWAMQASFVDGTRQFGAGHLGLQWYADHPGSTAVNWGGYDANGRELDGSVSELPSAPRNPNTRDFLWRAGQPYRLSISTGSRPGSWSGAVNGQTVRELHAGGTGLTGLTVWSEVFARCDDPSVVVRWSDLSASTPTGSISPDRLSVSYQSRADGGCDNTTVRVRSGCVEQITKAPRTVPPGAVLDL